MTAHSLHCGKCKAILPAMFFQANDFVPCPSCERPLKTVVFPALFKPPAVGQAAERILMESEAACFYHPQKKAVVPCESCGRFLCALCDVELNDQHLCPVCLESGRKKGKLKNLENQRLLYDRLALTAAILPVILGFWPSIVGAPIALFISVRYYREPGNITGGSKIRFWAAGILAIAEIIIWLIVIVSLVAR